MSINPKKMTENELHEYVAEVEGHDAQITGVVGYFYRMYRQAVIDRLGRLDNREILEVGCGEGVMFDGTDIAPVQMDVSLRRARLARKKRSQVLCGDGYSLPFPSESFSVVLLVAVIEHTSRPWDVLQEARRVLKPGGFTVIVVPNDVNMSVGRLLLGKFPIRYPDHLTFVTPRRMKRWLADGFQMREALTLPFRQLPFMANLFYVVVAEKVS